MFYRVFLLRCNIAHSPSYLRQTKEIKLKNVVI